MNKLRRLLPLIVLVLAGVLALGATALARHARHHRGRVVTHHVHKSAGREITRAPNVPGQAAKARAAERDEGGEGEEENEALRAAEEYDAARTAPARNAPAEALSAARAEAAALPATGAFSELTNQPYDSDAPAFRDPVWSNSGGGSGLVSGRMTAVAARGKTVFAGAADGGVWRSADAGAHWTPVLDHNDSISVGSVAISPGDGSVWVGLGEANENSDAYLGQGVMRSNDDGRTWHYVGGTQLRNMLVGRLTFDKVGHVYAATSKGLFRRSTDSDSGPWSRVLRPGTGPYGTTFVNDVKVKPGTKGKVVIADVGWRTGTPYNGLYQSSKSGVQGSWHLVRPGGDLHQADVGRATFAYTPNGQRLYAVVQSPRLQNNPDPEDGSTVLAGVFRSDDGLNGPWKRIADEPKLLNSGSGLVGQFGYGPGVQAWYNQFLQVDPRDPNHVYLGLEEVFETHDAGATWRAIGPYWNFPFACFARDPDSCPKTTHPDQHGAAIANGRLFVANDGGMYRRTVGGADLWADLNADLHTLQYYFADSGPVAGGDAWWGGLQDNGESLLLPGRSRQVSPFGGDGGDTMVDKTDGNKAVVEYTGLDMNLTTNGGRSRGNGFAFREISPSCVAFTYTPDPCDPTPRFIAPFEADSADPNHWVAGGEYVWDDHKAWGTRCSDTACDWKIVHDTGAGRSITALGVNRVTYAGWCGPCNPDEPGEADGGFQAGIDTNYGGHWHRITAPNLPNRYVASLTVDPANRAHVYAVYNGFSRRWIEGGGEGHVFESTNGGATWTDISGNLPDVGGDDLVISHGKLVVATDIGTFIASASNHTQWARFGPNLPSASVNDLAFSSDGSHLVAATHGRGLWISPSP